MKLFILRTVKFTLLLFAVLLLSSCIALPHQQYRDNYSLCISANPEVECQANSLQEYKDQAAEDQEYLLGFVEFDDQGQLWDREQLNQLMTKLSEDNASQEMLFMVFVHGWKHSAKAGDGNIASFRRTLKRLSALDTSMTQSLGTKPRKIAGIYLGWRGGSVSWPVLKELTFWDRKSTAHKVGYGGVTEVLSRLDLLKKTKNALNRQDGENSDTRLVIVGHSFGGAVVYSAVSEILENNFVQTVGPVSVSSDSVGLADLVVLINPAFEAARFSSLRDMSTERGSYFVSQLPVLAVLTSEADQATRLAFPAGRYFSTLFERERDVKRKNAATQQFETIDQGQANVTALGHFGAYNTHYLQATSKQSDDLKLAISLDEEVQTFLSVSKSWEQDRPGSKINFTGATLQRSENSAGRNPYLNILVDRELIKDHNDIEDPRIESFIRHLIMIALQTDEMESRKDNRAKIR